MKYENVIDMSSYFYQLQQQNKPAVKKAGKREELCSGFIAAVETSAAIIMALCMCVCTTIVMTMG